jgi:hypothetical protein
MTALRREHQRDKNAGSEKRHGMLVFETESHQNAEPQPKDRRTSVDNPDQQIYTSNPEQRFKRVH